MFSFGGLLLVFQCKNSLISDILTHPHISIVLETTLFMEIWVNKLSGQKGQKLVSIYKTKKNKKLQFITWLKSAKEELFVWKLSKLHPSLNHELFSYGISSVQLLSRVQFFATPWNCWGFFLEKKKTERFFCFVFIMWFQEIKPYYYI